MKNPCSKAEWQGAVDAAAGALALDAARQYGLITGAPEVNVARCEQILKRGRQLGITPAPDAIDRFTQLLALQ